MVPLFIIFNTNPVAAVYRFIQAAVGSTAPRSSEASLDSPRGEQCRHPDTRCTWAPRKARFAWCVVRYGEIKMSLKWDKWTILNRETYEILTFESSIGFSDLLEFGYLMKLWQRVPSLGYRWNLANLRFLCVSPVLRKSVATGNGWDTRNAYIEIGIACQDILPYRSQRNHDRLMNAGDRKMHVWFGKTRMIISPGTRGGMVRSASWGTWSLARTSKGHSPHGLPRSRWKWWKWDR